MNKGFVEVARRRGLAAMLALAVVLCSFAGTVQAQERAPLPDCHVVSIGVDKYVRGAGVDHDLSGCVNDATNLADRMTDQVGKMFATVNRDNLLLNENATEAAVQKAMAQAANQSKPGDWVVFIMSSHGGINQQSRWEGVLHDGKRLTDTTLLDWTNDLASKQRKVWIILDTCQAGQLRLNAQELLERYTDPKGGGIILMLATVPSESSEALGKYSTYAEAVNEGLLGDADYNRDGKITLKELRHYAYRRAYELNRLYQKPVQNGECCYSMSIPETMVVGTSRMKTLLQVNADLTKQDGRDKVRSNSFHKAYEVKLESGVKYVIDLKSSAFDAYLRLEDAQGIQVAYNDDVTYVEDGKVKTGWNRDSRIIYTPTQSGTFRVIATTFTNDGTGPFTLKVRHALGLAKTASAGQPQAEIIKHVSTAQPAKTAVAVQAKDEFIKDFSSPQIEKFVTEQLKADIKKTMLKDNILQYATPDGQFDIYLVPGDKAVVFQYPFATLKLPLEKVNEWNNRGGGNGFTRAFVDKSGQVFLAASLNLTGGLSQGQFTSFYARIEQELRSFETAYLPK